MQKTPVKTPNRIPTRTPNRTPNKPSTPKNKTQLVDQTFSSKDELQSSQISDIKEGQNVRVLRLQQSSATNFLGVNSFPNLRSLDLNETLSSLSNTSIIVAFRSLFIKYINGQEILTDDIISSFNYSGLVTVALRQGMNPELNSDPNVALQDSIEFLHSLSKFDPKQFLNDSSSSLYTIEEKDDQKLITLNVKADVYSWSILDSDCCWQPLNSINSLNNSNPNANANVQENTNSIISRLNYPLKCEIKNASIRNATSSATAMKSCSIYIPEFDNKYHVYAEINGDPSEGRILSLKAPLSANVEWKYSDDGTVINRGSHILPLTPNEVGHVIECDVTLCEGYPTTKLFSAPIKPGEFRFRSLRLQGELVEGDEIEFDVSTKGTKAKFVGIRILRSSKHGDWEHIAFISSNNEQKDDQNEQKNENEPNQQKNENEQNEQKAGNNSETNQKMKYKLTVYDIGCVIRAVCITDGAGPPLMLTSYERVQPSPPQFNNPNIFGAGTVGMPLFAVAQYNGGLQGNCCYEWKIENKGEKEKTNEARSFQSTSTIPIMVPKEEDIGKIITCKMTPIRNDGSLGETVEARLSEPISQSGPGLRECFLEYRKKTRSGRLQMSVVEEKEDSYTKLFKIHEGETIIVSQPCDWAVVTQNGIKAAGHSKMFTADGGSIKGIVVMFTDEYFAIAGQIEAAQPTASDVKVTVDSNSSFLTAEFKYSGGIEGRSIIQWNRNDGTRETVVGFGKSMHYGVSDRGCTFKAIVTPQSLDGKCGTPVSSEPFLIDDNCIIDERPIVSIIKAPEAITEDDEIHVTTSTENEEKEDSKERYVVISQPLAKKYKIVWTSSGKYVDEGPDFKVLDKYANKPLSMLIVDRLRDIVITQHDWETVTALIGKVVNLQLVSSVFDENRQKISIEKSFENGKEGDSKLVWRIYEKNNPDELNSELSERKEPFLLVDKTFEGYYVTVEYFPKNTSQADYGESVLSNKLMVPIRHPPAITITKAEIVPNKDFTELLCKVKTEGEGRIEYEWAYGQEGQAENNEPILTGEVSKSHEITVQDFECDVYCTVNVYGPNDKKPCDTAQVYATPNVNTLFTPTIQKAEITTPVKNPCNEYTLGQELEVSISEYQGIPYTEVNIEWQRCDDTTLNSSPKKKKSEKGKDDADLNWKTISTDPIYTATSADTGKKVRAVVEVGAAHEMLEEPVYSEKYTTDSIFISKNNQTILRIASALYRTKKALFDAKLPMGEKVVVSIENGMLLMKGGSSVLLRVQLSAVNVDMIEGTNNRISLKARHGYNTELTFNERKMSGGTKFTAPQTRELFIETLNLFKQD